MKYEIELPDISQHKTEMVDNFRVFRETRSIAARDSIVCKHLHIVHSIARRFSGLGESIDDLIQEGTIGLLKAVDLFDPDRGVKFSTYACHLITSQIQHYLRDRGRLIRQPAWVQELNTKVSRATEQLAQELGRDPQLAEVAERLNLTEASVHNVLAARELNSVVSLNAPNENGIEHDVPQTDKEKILSNKLSALQLPVEERIILEEAVNSLKTLEQSVVRLFFFEDLNQSEIARKLGISVNYSSYLLRRSITKIKTILENQRTEENAALHEDAESVKIITETPTYDRYTGLYTAEYLRGRIAEEIARGRRYPTNFALMLVEITGLIRGREDVPQLIVPVGQMLRQSTRIIDLTAYMEKGRFALLLPHTGREAKILGERLRQQFQNMNNSLTPKSLSLNLSIGYAVYPMDGNTTEGLIKRAERSLHAAIKGDTAGK
ncbi:MAG TPA: sigma-70 family RNA polymerase sigma factor [Armatimonadota bacterium]|nr:sigma-70 family RNA polymerase sigma factor [Armatimonadota bacterium]